MATADPAPASLARTAGAHRRVSSRDRVGTTRRWAVGVLALATVALAGYLVLLVVATALVATFVSGVFDLGPVGVDARSLVPSVATVLLVGWCTGLATSAAIAGGEVLGPRTAGLVAGGTGTVAGLAALALTGLL